MSVPKTKRRDRHHIFEWFLSCNAIRVRERQTDRKAGREPDRCRVSDKDRDTGRDRQIAIRELGRNTVYAHLYENTTWSILMYFRNIQLNDNEKKIDRL